MDVECHSCHWYDPFEVQERSPVDVPSPYSVMKLNALLLSSSRPVSFYTRIVIVKSSRVGRDVSTSQFSVTHAHVRRTYESHTPSLQSGGVPRLGCAPSWQRL